MLPTINIGGVFQGRLFVVFCKQISCTFVIYTRLNSSDTRTDIVSCDGMDEGQAVVGQQEQEQEDMTVVELPVIPEHRRIWCSADGRVSKLVLKEGTGKRGRGRLGSTGELREAFSKHIKISRLGMESPDIFSDEFWTMLLDGGSAGGRWGRGSVAACPALPSPATSGPGAGASSSSGRRTVRLTAPSTPSSLPSETGSWLSSLCRYHVIVLCLQPCLFRPVMLMSGICSWRTEHA